jgi:hypothetical protein
MTSSAPTIDDKLSEALDVYNEKKAKQKKIESGVEILPPVKHPLNRDDMEQRILDSDHDFVREKLRTIITEGIEALSELRKIADETADANAYTGVAVLIKTIGDTADTLMEVSKTKKTTEQISKKTSVISGSIDKDKKKPAHVGDLSSALESLEPQITAV